MNYSKYRFNLDMQSYISQISLPVRQHDTGIVLRINLTDGGVPYVIRDGCRAVFYARKSDGNPLMNDCIIEKNTTICYELTQQTTSCSGVVDCEVRLYGSDGNLITTPRFILVIDSRVVHDEDFPLSEAEQTVLDNIILSEQKRQKSEEQREETYEKMLEATEEASSLAATLRQKLDTGDYNGITPHIGANGNWWFDDEDTGILASGYTIPLRVGEGSHSLEQQDEAKSNKAITENSVALGEGNIAGCKGYYIRAIFFGNSTRYPQIALSEIQPDGVLISTEPIPKTEGFITPKYDIDDYIYINMGNHYINLYKINWLNDASNNIITLYPDKENGVNTLVSLKKGLEKSVAQGSATLENGVFKLNSTLNFDDYTFSVPTKPEVGVVEVSRNAFAKGEGTKATGIDSTSSGRQTHALGPYGDASGRGTKAGYAAHAINAYNEALHHYTDVGGYHNRSDVEIQCIRGRWNAPNPDALFIIGNGGSEDRRSNAFEVLKDGSLVGDGVLCAAKGSFVKYNVDVPNGTQSSYIVDGVSKTLNDIVISEEAIIMFDFKPSVVFFGNSHATFYIWGETKFYAANTTSTQTYLVNAEPIDNGDGTYALRIWGGTNVVGGDASKSPPEIVSYKPVSGSSYKTVTRPTMIAVSPYLAMGSRGPDNMSDSSNSQKLVAFEVDGKDYIVSSGTTWSEWAASQGITLNEGSLVQDSITGKNLCDQFSRSYVLSGSVISAGKYSWFSDVDIYIDYVHYTVAEGRPLSTFLPNIGYNILTTSSPHRFADNLTGKIVKNSDGVALATSEVATNANYFCNIAPNGSAIINFTIDCLITCWVQVMDDHGFEITSYDRTDEDWEQSYSIDASKESTTWGDWVARINNPKFSVKDGYIMYDGQYHVRTADNIYRGEVLSTDLIKNGFCYHIYGQTSEQIDGGCVCE